MHKIRNQTIIIVIISFILTGCQSKSEPSQPETLINEDLNGIVVSEIDYYEIDIEVDNEKKSFIGEQKTTFTNTTGKELTDIYFRLYPNAFKKYEDAPNLFFENDYTKESYVPGYIDIETLTIAGKDAPFSIEGIDETLLKIELDEILRVDELIEIEMEYFVKLPTSMDRFGYGEEAINFGNWYPVLSVYGEDGWSKDPYYALGDPFYTDIGNYDVNITVDEEIIVATGGNILNIEMENGKKQYQIEGKLIRDFAFVTSPDFKIVEEMVGDTVVKLYYPKGSRKVVNSSLQYAVDSLKTFNEQFGTYPYGTYSVVITDFSGGMEYPGIVFISEDYFHRRLLSFLEQVIVHETAHQWWYGLVGNDEVKEAWLDEGLTSYSEVIYIDHVYGNDQATKYYRMFFEDQYDQIDELLPNDEQIVNKPLDEFDNWTDYGLLVYTKPTVFLEEIKEEYGKDTLMNILSTYFEEYKYQNATTEDFLTICEDVTGDRFDAMSKKWLQ